MDTSLLTSSFASIRLMLLQTFSFIFVINSTFHKILKMIRATAALSLACVLCYSPQASAFAQGGARSAAFVTRAPTALAASTAAFSVNVNHAAGCGCPSCRLGHSDSCSCANCRVGHGVACACANCRVESHGAACGCSSCASAAHSSDCACGSCSSTHGLSCGCARCL